MPVLPHAGPRRRGPPGALSGVVAALCLAGCAGTGGPLPGARAFAGLVVLALFTLAALGAGGPAARVLGAGRRPALVELPIRAALGAATLALAAGMLGATGLLGRVPLGMVLLASAAAGLPVLLRQGRAAARGAGRPPAVPLVLLAASATLTLLVASAPSPFYDQFHYHLAFPEHWLRTGRIQVFERQTYSYFPANAGLLYVYALAGPGAYGAQLLHWWCGALAAASAGALARLAGGGRDAFWNAAALVAVTPSVLLLSGWAGSDLAVAAFGAAAWLALLGSRRRGTARRGVAAGLLGGAAVGCKYVAAATVALPLAVGAVAATLLRPRAGRGRVAQAGILLLALAAGGLVAYAPWGVRNAWLTGDPMYPFLASRLAALAGDSGATETARTAAGIASPVAEGSRLAAALTLRAFSPQGDAGSVGYVWLLAMPAWIVATLARRRRAAAPVLLAGVFAGVALWSQFHQLGRYLVPVLVVAAAGAGATWSAARRALPRPASWAVSGLVAVLVVLGAPSGTDVLTAERLNIALGRGDAGALMKRYVSYWPMIPIVNRELPADAVLLLVAESRILHLEREVLVDDPFRVPLLVELADRTAGARGVAAELRRRGVTHVLVNEHEADRIRRMTGRSSYFEPRNRTAAAALHGFLATCLDGMARVGPVSLHRLDAACGESPEGARDAGRPATADDS